LSTDETPVIVETVRLLLAVDVVGKFSFSVQWQIQKKTAIETNNKETNNVTNMYHKFHYQPIDQFDLTKAVVNSFAQILQFYFACNHV